jgi:cytochrome c-type biogenesis protein
MSGGIGHLVLSGPLILAVPVAAAAGVVTFLSPCCLPLVPGYLSYVTGMSGADAEVAGAQAADAQSAGRQAEAAGAQAAGARSTGTVLASVAVPARPARSRVLAGTALFVLGFAALFTTEGVAFGGLGSTLKEHSQGLTQVLGGLVIVLGLMFAGVFDRFAFAGRIMRPSVRPRAGLASAPLIGVLFGLSWTPCAGPTLAAVLTLGMVTGTAARAAVLAFVYALGLGIPFLIVALAVQRGMSVFGFARRHARAVARVGGLMLVTVGVLEVTGAWTSALIWLQVHWFGSYYSPL